MGTLTDRIVDDLYTTATQAPQLHDITFCRQRLIDYVGVTFAGAHLLQRELGMLLAHHTGHGPVPLIGLAATSDPRTAALCNGMSAHVAELDDGERHGMVHPGAPVISALLAAACAIPQAAPNSLDLWRAMLTGYESTLRMARLLQPQLKEQGYHASGVCGTIGAAMGVAALLGLSKEQMKTAFSAAVTSAAGSLKVIRGSSQLKPYNTGQAALNGYNAAAIAQTGLSGPEDVLEGEQGFVRMITGITGESLMVKWPTGESLAHGIYIKPYAACRHCHAPIEATLALRAEHNLTPEAVEAITVTTHRYAVHLHDHTEIPNPASGKMSIPYSVAAALVTGEAGMAAFSPERVADPTIQTLTRKVRVEEDPGMTQRVPAERMARVEITLKGVTRHGATVALPKGEPETPLTSDEMEAKFIDLMGFAGHSPADAHHLLQQIEQLDGKLSPLWPLLSSKKP